jgi:hypothetical protein
VSNKEACKHLQRISYPSTCKGFDAWAAHATQALTAAAVWHTTKHRPVLYSSMWVGLASGTWAGTHCALHSGSSAALAVLGLAAHATTQCIHQGGAIFAQTRKPRRYRTPTAAGIYSSPHMSHLLHTVIHGMLWLQAGTASTAHSKRP